MVQYQATIHKFEQKGDKTGWSFIEVPADIAQQLKPGNKKTFRVRGRLDHFPVQGIALLPMGEGSFILALNAEIRKGIGKSEGASLLLQLEEDTAFRIEPPADLIQCLEDDPEALAWFNSLAPSHRDYFSKWIDSAKTIETRTIRITQTLKAMEQKQSYGEMIRSNRKT